MSGEVTLAVPDFLADPSGEPSAPRHAHYAATVIGVSSGILVLASLAPWWVLAGGILAGHVLAFGSHLVLERNRPVVLHRPRLMLLTTAADFHMCALAIRGRLAGELRRHGRDRETSPARHGKPLPGAASAGAQPRDESDPAAARRAA